MTLPPGTWRATNQTRQINGVVDKIPPYDPRSAEHFWIVITSYQVKPDQWTETNMPILDMENMVSLTPPGCYHCEQMYTPTLRHRRCPGQPKE